MRVVLAILLFAAMAFADNFKLYLKDGTHHMVREYQVVEDRVTTTPSSAAISRTPLGPST
jgi:hypothetical protein